MQRAAVFRTPSGKLDAQQPDTMSGDQKSFIKGGPSMYVKLNVGGVLYFTTIGTLTKRDTMLRAMFSGRMEVLTDSEGNLKRIIIKTLI